MFTKLLELNRIIEGKAPRTKLERMNQKLGEAYQHGIAICFDRTTGEYVESRIVQGSDKVVYREGSGPNGYSRVAVQPYTDAVKTVPKLNKAVNAFAKDLKVLKGIFTLISKAFKEEIIIKDVLTKIEGFSLKANKPPYAFIFLAFVQDGNMFPFYDEKEVQSYMIEKAFNDYATVTDNGKKIPLVRDNSVCYVCAEAGKRVYGNFSVIKCFNLDKPGMIVGGYGVEESCKNFPVCENCIESVSSAYDYAWNKLKFNLCNESYLLLPCLRTEDEALAKTIVKLLEEMGNTTKTSEYGKITGSQNNILEELAEVGHGKDQLTLTMIFFEESNASWKITAEIPEILPSRISRIHAVKRAVEADEYLKMGEKPFYFSFNIIKDFAGNSGKTSQRKFLAYVDAVFSGSKISEAAFLSDVVRAVLAKAKPHSKEKSDAVVFMVRDALAAWQFMNQLGIFEKGVRDMSDAVGTGGKYGRFVEEHKDFFDVQEKVVAFLTGCYVSNVLFVQKESLNSSPFYKKLRGMKLDMKRLQSLYPEARNKIQQYDAFDRVHDLDPLLAAAWVECGNDWQITDDEATLSFTIGLSLDYNITK
jgi:CRISPR-associated protein Csh1